MKEKILISIKIIKVENIEEVLDIALLKETEKSYVSTAEVYTATPAPIHFDSMN